MICVKNWDGTAPLEDQSQAFSDDSLSCGDTACASGLDSDPMATRVRENIVFAAFACSSSSWQKSS